jgi:hypothetical protein
MSFELSAQMEQRCIYILPCPCVCWCRCDTNLPEYSFDAIIDKGLLDSIVCGQCGAIDVQVYIIEIERLLKDTGVFIVVSHGNPDERLHFLEQYDIDELYYTPWEVSCPTGA